MSARRVSKGRLGAVPAAAAQLTRESIVVARSDNISCDFGDEMALLDFSSGMYFGLAGVGARIWKLLAEPRSVGEICDVLVAEFDVAAERCERDLISLLGELAARGLVETGRRAPSRQ